MKIRIDSDEYYPFYSFQEGDGRFSMEIDEATLARWTRVMDEFYQVQSEMGMWGL